MPFKRYIHLLIVIWYILTQEIKYMIITHNSMHKDNTITFTHNQAFNIGGLYAMTQNYL